MRGKLSEAAELLEGALEGHLGRLRHRLLEVRGMEVVRVGPDGKIVVNNLYYDNLAVAVQLGLVPEGAIA